MRSGSILSPADEMIEADFDKGVSQMKFGELSAKYESSGDPGAIAYTEGDAGGTSYGAYQFAANAGVPQDFIQWLLQQGYGPAIVLAEAGDHGTNDFDEAWLQVADNDPDGFLAMQNAYVGQQYYEPAAQLLRNIGFDVEGRSAAIREVIWSAAVQYGPQWITDLFQEAGGPAFNAIDDATLIQNIYAVRASDEWTSGSPALRPGLRARFEAECSQALAML